MFSGLINRFKKKVEEPVHVPPVLDFGSNFKVLRTTRNEDKKLKFIHNYTYHLSKFNSGYYYKLPVDYLTSYIIPLKVGIPPFWPKDPVGSPPLEETVIDSMLCDICTVVPYDFYGLNRNYIIEWNQQRLRFVDDNIYIFETSMIEQMSEWVVPSKHDLFLVCHEEWYYLLECKNTY